MKTLLILTLLFLSCGDTITGGKSAGEMRSNSFNVIIYIDNGNEIEVNEHRSDNVWHDGIYIYVDDIDNEETVAYEIKQFSGIQIK